MSIYKEVNEFPHCGSCGKLMPTWEIVEERAGRNIVFCSVQCVGVFDTYKWAKYGEEGIFPESILA